MRMTKEALLEIVEKHKLWLINVVGGERANLSDAYLRGADLRDASLGYANLRGADLSSADLSNAYLRDTNLRGANLLGADLSSANLSDANLSYADLRGADLRDADLSGAKGVLSPSNFIKDNFERTKSGYIAYKTFGGRYEPPVEWKIEAGSIIRENVNFNRTEDCGCGINVATLDWVRNHYGGEIWKVLIRWEWLAGVCVPYSSDGKIRCEQVELVKTVK